MLHNEPCDLQFFNILGLVFMTYKLVKLETLSEDYKKEHAGDEAGQSCRVI